MKNRASGLLKQIITVITAMAKAKTLALKSKTRAIKTRLIIFSLLRNKKILMSSISEKLRSLAGHQDYKKVKRVVEEAEAEAAEEEDDVCMDDDQSKAVVLHNAMSMESLPNPTHTEFPAEEELQEQYGYGYCNDGDGDDVDDKYPDLTHSLFDLAELDAGGSVIDLVKNSKPEGEEFRLEDEINQVADLFIMKFHRQMMIQKQLSIKMRHMETLERSV